MPSHRDQRGGPTRGGLAGRGGATRDHDVAGFQLMDVKGTISQDMTVASDIINHTIPDADDDFPVEHEARDTSAVFPEGSHKASPFHDTTERPKDNSKNIEIVRKSRPGFQSTLRHGATSDHGQATNRVYTSPNDPGVQEFQKLLHDRIDSLPGFSSHTDPRTSLLIDQLVSAVSRLKVENELLMRELDDTKLQVRNSEPRESDGQVSDTQLDSSGTMVGEATPTPDDAPCFETLHRVYCTHVGHKFLMNHYHRTLMGVEDELVYKDAPRMFVGDSQNDHIRGITEVETVKTYLEKHQKTVFAIRYSYRCDGDQSSYLYSKAEYRNGKLTKNTVPAPPSTEGIVVGSCLRKTIRAIMSARPERFQGYDAEELSNLFLKPFLFFYAHNTTLLELVNTVDLSLWAKKSIRFLCGWMEENWRGVWDEADALFSRGKVNEKVYGLLFRPNELIITKQELGGERLDEATKIARYPWFSDVDADFYYWDFNGHFSRSGGSLDLSKLPDEEQLMKAGTGWRKLEHDITSLNRYPIRFAPPSLRDRLVARGSRVWDCRRKKLVCYHDGNQHPGDEVSNVQDRYMIDYTMYRRLYPNKDIFDVPDKGDIVPKDGDEPPDDDFLACLPATIHGFSFSSKSWNILRVDRITDVTWNKEAFKQLVAPDDTKELIQAVVTAHGQRLTSAPDIIDGKGKGLLILLHGGPGTGKTLTAESIADQQERPLYRVTCGDIGTEPAEVERYLGAVLEIGKAWGCVVLLDEADVFLEERSFTDQKRNAIISIFLRVLEYYDGILILTTNRVGSFDEAFKSRIQLALGYPKLNEEDRLKIWQNFTQMLSRTKERIDIEDLDRNLHKLAIFEMNGRQIRNVITMARHLAKYRKETLRFRHMHDAVQSVLRFNEYLDQVKGVPDELWAREDKLR